MRYPLFFLCVDLFAVDKEHDVGVLLDRAALAEVAELGDVGLALVSGARELGTGDDRNI